VQWPDDVRPDDARLYDALDATTLFAPEVQVQRVLRHVAGRRVTALAERDGNACIVKVFHGPRARGNHRRLRSLHEAGIGHLVPTPLAHDASGRVGLLDFHPGTVLDQLDDRHFVRACGLAGLALRSLHDCGAELDREWTLDDELRQLASRAPTALVPLVEDTIRLHGRPPVPAAVPSHRDCHPRQLVHHEGQVRWIDLDDCAMATPGLDVGNMLAHLTREHLIGRRTAEVAALGRDAFATAYDWPHDPAELRRWETLSLTRLACLAEQRHHDLAQRDALVDAVQRLRWGITA
jgi:hypothetical protein